jgi:hypothetical protein
LATLRSIACGPRKDIASLSAQYLLSPRWWLINIGALVFYWRLKLIAFDKATKARANPNVECLKVLLRSRSQTKGPGSLFDIRVSTIILLRPRACPGEIVRYIGCEQRGSQPSATSHSQMHAQLINKNWISKNAAGFMRNPRAGLVMAKA